MSTTGNAVGQVKELKMMKVDETAVKEHIDKIVRGTNISTRYECSRELDAGGC